MRRRRWRYGRAALVFVVSFSPASSWPAIARELIVGTPSSAMASLDIMLEFINGAQDGLRPIPVGFDTFRRNQPR